LLAPARQKLFSIRRNVLAPSGRQNHRGLERFEIFSAFARAAQVLNDAYYLEASDPGSDLYFATIYDESGEDSLFRSYREGRGKLRDSPTLCFCHSRLA